MKTVTAKKIYIRTFGCQMNEYDSNRIVDLMTGGNGYVKTPAPDDADLIVINTCSVRDKAQQKVFSLSLIAKLDNLMKYRVFPLAKM